nr:unnamed protein product [Digitaria exilis]
MSTLPLPQFTASSLPLDISSLSWGLVHLACGHQRLRDESLHALLQPIDLCVMYPDFLVDLGIWPAAVE